MHNNKNNNIRIIGGSLKSRRFSVLPNSNIRPTTDRVRETVFNWLMHKIQNSRCLDLFTGSAALSIESISRGADFVYINDLDHKNINHINKTLNNFSISKSKYILSNKNALTLLKKTPQELNLNSFDIIFLDPPFYKNLLKPCLELIIKNNWLKDSPSSAIYYEVEAEKELDVLSILNNITLNNKQRLNISAEKTAGALKYGIITIEL